MRKCIGRSFDSDIRIHAKFREYAWNSAPEEWEFYYSTDGTAPVPYEIPKLYRLILTGTKSDVCVNTTDRIVYKVSHNFTDVPVYVVDKSTAKKSVILRKAVTQLERYLAHKKSAFSNLVLVHHERIRSAHAVMLSTFHRTAYDQRDVFIERVPEDPKFVTLTNQAREMNMELLRSLNKQG